VQTFPNQRLWDLARYARAVLHQDDLITDEEYAMLAEDHFAVARLEDYDVLRKDLDAEKARVKELEAELRGDVDSLICKCGYEDCDAVIAEYDVEDCNWTDTHRIERLRAIILKRHYDESPSEARVKKLEERLERVRDICIGWSSMKEYTRTERRILAQLRDAIAATGKETENG